MCECRDFPRTAKPVPFLCDGFPNARDYDPLKSRNSSVSNPQCAPAATQKRPGEKGEKNKNVLKIRSGQPAPGVEGLPEIGRPLDPEPGLGGTF
jgi:hypothetical protein